MVDHLSNLDNNLIVYIFVKGTHHVCTYSIKWKLMIG
jgi:hypothetical protein